MKSHQSLRRKYIFKDCSASQRTQLYFNNKLVMLSFRHGSFNCVETVFSTQAGKKNKLFICIYSRGHDGYLEILMYVAFVNPSLEA